MSKKRDRRKLFPPRKASMYPRPTFDYSTKIACRVRALFAAERVSRSPRKIRYWGSLSVRASSYTDGTRRRGITTMKGEKELVDTATASRTSKSRPVLILREVISFLSLGSLYHPTSFFLSPRPFIPPLFHRWLSVRWAKIGSTITREFAVWLDRSFSRGSCLSSGYKRVSPVTNVVVPTTIPFTSELFSSCRCAMNRKLAMSLVKLSILYALSYRV